MAGAVKTKTTELPDSRVRVEVEVPTEALERELNTAASQLGREMRVPGFRSGKVPPEVVLRQVGREAVLDEAVRRGLPGWYEEALADAGIQTVGDPQVDLSDLPEKGAPLAFTIEVGVVPPAQLGEYKGVEVGRREPKVDDQEVQAELERMRESLASLETVEREAGEGDFVVMDYVGSVDGTPFEGGEGRGQVVELGSGRLIPGFEEQLTGASAGEERTVELTFPDDYPAEHLAGKDASFAVEVKEVKEKRLPELDDDFAVEAGGYDSLDELRAEIESRIGQAEERAIEAEFREAAVDAVVDQAKIEVPHELVHSKAHEMWHRTARRLAAQGIQPGAVPPDGRQDGGGARRRVRVGRRDGAQARGRAGRDRRGRGHRGLRRGDRAGAARLRAPRRERQAAEAGAEARALAGSRRGAPRGHRDAQGRGPRGREREADLGGAGGGRRRARGGAREALDARERQLTRPLESRPL